MGTTPEEEPAVTATQPAPGAIEYPDSDGKRMADNTQQYRWIVKVQGNLDIWYRDNPDVFVAGDHLIYAAQGDPKKRRAPDVDVAFGRPKGDRGSYQVWLENGVFPQVIFEVLSPKNRVEEMRKKKAFYRHYGAEEYYVINPQRKVPTVEIFLRVGGRFVKQKAAGFVSPRLGVRFEPTATDLVLYLPDGRPFLTLVELGEKAEEETKRADDAEQRADAEQQRADAEQRRAEAEKRRADGAEKRFRAEADARAVLAAKLRELGLDPDSLTAT
jgi:Uma2 family endonuclease